MSLQRKELTSLIPEELIAGDLLHRYGPGGLIPEEYQARDLLQRYGPGGQSGIEMSHDRIEGQRA